MKRKKRKLLLTLFIIYTALILYFLYFGFGRPGAAVSMDEYRYNVIPNLLSLRFVTISDFEYFQPWFFNFGNFAGFIPIGILIPLLYPCKFFRFISLFFLSILMVESVQMLTFLGSFDINDAIVNTLGAAVGFGAYKMGFRFTSIKKSIRVTIMSAAILSIAVIGFSELLNKSFTKKEGAVVPLHELKTTENIRIDNDLHSIEIGHEKIEPKINLYESDGDHVESFTYSFNGQDIVLSLNYGIPDNAGDNGGKVVISVDGQEIESYSNKEQVSSEIQLERVHELTITIEGNAKLWDVTCREMKYWWN
ncbi:VanZ family protein [Sporosarcina cyprini]|uniref:VanZ family protein n=1 Tax=Sporosarcina cyprini TaxID=2910523 RepID=UPI001EDE0419|nr:VanZ family protein [Sporosarcina cyprini]MCG3086602.1 VanZ family protein [Sporosarcina cyprini]